MGQFIGHCLKKSAVCNSRIELSEGEGIVCVHREGNDFKSHKDFEVQQSLAELAQND